MRTYSALVFDNQQLMTFINQLPKGLGSSNLVQILSTQPATIASRYAAYIKQVLPDSEVIGHSTRHVVYESQIHHGGTLICVAQFEHTQFSSFSLDLNDDPEQDACTVIEQLAINQKSKAIISFSHVTNSWDYNLYQALGKRCDVPICGGLAASVNGRKEWLLHGVKTYHKGAVFVALHSEVLQIWRNAFSEWNTIGSPLCATSVSGSILHTINHKPAHEVYRDRLADGRELSLEQMLSFPLQLTNQQICIPTAIYPDGSIEFDKPIELGDELQLCYNHPSLTLEQVGHDVRNLAQFNPQAIFIYNCESRLEFIEGMSEIKPFDKFESCNGSYCMGELFREKHQDVLHHSMTYLALSEDSRRPPLDLSEQTESYPISPLFHLIRYSIEELDEVRLEMERKLAAQTEKLINSYRLDKRTGLKNRVALQEALKVVAPDEHVITLKLSNFHQVNEKYGYQVADELISDLSDHFVDRLSSRHGSEMVKSLYYIGTAEWAIVFHSQQSSDLIKQEFSQFADQIEHINFEPYGLPDVDYLSVSIIGGIASVADFPDVTGDELLLKAIDARRRGKERNTHFMNARDCGTTMEEHQDRLGLMGSVSRAILNQRIITYSQPIFAAYSREQISQECLVRIEDDGEIISPGRFLPIIEGTHLYTRLSRYMMTSTLDFMADKQESFSINLSPQDMLSDRTLSILEQAVRKLNDPSRLGIEVLESEQIKDFARMAEVCGHFKKMGVRILVDDFGSGYSNIDEIIRLEPDVIKLDGSLIKTIDVDNKQRQITGQLVQLCQVLNAKTVAEFVHNPKVCQIAEDLGVDYLQGFHLAEPTRLF
ncbi:diguanylate cyclase [Vibrio variabilis]|uniref:Diguanylate cyclase n=1 Tax=Vibrio variabilis TaxID=990271 RepID=A0ABR4Y9W0_9VIBR|nr:EAL domain-containing protein [Vibrio variabilis]KHA59742.1 diguanylate cyclase [Vibrio variabilis]